MDGEAWGCADGCEYAVNIKGHAEMEEQVMLLGAGIYRRL